MIDSISQCRLDSAAQMWNKKVQSSFRLNGNGTFAHASQNVARNRCLEDPGLNKGFQLVEDQGEKFGRRFQHHLLKGITDRSIDSQFFVVQYFIHDIGFVTSLMATTETK